MSPTPTTPHTPNHTSGGTGPAQKTRAVDLAPDVARLHGEGLGRNEIARRLGASRASVTRAAKLAGVEFDASATQQATAVVVLTGKARRAALVERLMEVSAEKLEIVARVQGHHLEDVRAVRDMAGALREVTIAAATAVDKSLKLEELEKPERDWSAVDAFHAAMLPQKDLDDDLG